MKPDGSVRSFLRFGERALSPAPAGEFLPDAPPFGQAISLLRIRGADILRVGQKAEGLFGPQFPHAAGSDQGSGFSPATSGQLWRQGRRKLFRTIGLDMPEDIFHIVWETGLLARIRKPGALGDKKIFNLFQWITVLFSVR